MKVDTEVIRRSDPGRPSPVMRTRVQELRQPMVTQIPGVSRAWARMAANKDGHVHTHSQQSTGRPAKMRSSPRTCDTFLRGNVLNAGNWDTCRRYSALATGCVVTASEITAAISAPTAIGMCRSHHGNWRKPRRVWLPAKHTRTVGREDLPPLEVGATQAPHRTTECSVCRPNRSSPVPTRGPSSSAETRSVGVNVLQLRSG